jgi:transcriptional regulator with XRE-family HTH domain
MAGAPLHERLRRTRAQHGEDLASLSARTGLRVQHIRAIEDGRLRDLPPGIYGRAAIRSFAAAYGLDPEAVLADCRELLPQVEDPIDAMARARGVARTPEPASTAPAEAMTVSDVRLRPFAAATLDGIVAGALFVCLTGGAALLIRAPIASLGSSTAALVLVGLIFDAGYYVWLGGLVGTTLGEFTLGPYLLPRDPRPLTLRAIARRTLWTATADVRAIYVIGIWIRRRLTPVRADRIAPQPAPSPSPPPPHDRAEVLTWSMNQRACVPPLPLRRQRG